MAYTDEYGTTFSDDRKRLIKFNSSWNDYSVPDGTEVIAVNAFKGNQTIRTLYLPSSIKLIESGALEKCKIAEIHYTGNIEQWLQITWKSYFDQGYKLYFNGSQLVESIIIPESISVIKSQAFYYCTSLHSVIFNKNIKIIESNAFNKSGLQGIISIPRLCERIGIHAFFNCSGITKVKIPESTKEIGYGAFSACYGLKEFTVASDNSYYLSDRIGLYSQKKSSEIHESSLTLIALASGNKEKYRLDMRTSSIDKDACCFSSIPFNGLEIFNYSISIAYGAFRDTKGKVYAPFKLGMLLSAVGFPAENFYPIFVYKDALIGKDCPKVFAENPFRVLGVYANATQKEIQSNAAKIKRFLEIGQQPSFYVDFNNILPSLNRTQQMVDHALAQISQPKEKLAYAMFWFSEPCCEQHHKAEQLLREGNINDACDLLKTNCGDLRINLAPYICLADNNPDTDVDILDFITIFYSYLTGKKMRDENEQTIVFKQSLLDQICGDNFSISEEDCQILFIDMLMTFLNPVHLWTCLQKYHLSDGITKHLFNNTVGNNITHINSLIATTKTIDKKDSSKLLNAAKELRENTYKDLSAIRSSLLPSDVRLTSIHDSLANQILQLAIDSYNHATNRSSIAREIYSLMSYAKHIAKGDLLQSRCNENLKTMKEVIDELPPSGLENLDKELFAIVTRARNSADTIEQAKKLLKEAEPHLFKIRFQWLNEKKIGSKSQLSTYFSKVSTFIANVCLNKIIEDVNSSSINKSRSSWQVITALNQLPLASDFKKNRYEI